ncbi:hypothetical protein I317_00705 [Kwoniella heveanensis CBS 569]|nr:hypothetical protein I317_00705 [Kwoniella heveanensis CBS 569]
MVNLNEVQQPSNLSTSHSYFLKPSLIAGSPPIALLLRGVNLASVSKFPIIRSPSRSQSGPDSDSGKLYVSSKEGKTRAERDERRKILAGQLSHLGEEEVGFFSVAEEGGKDGWFVGRPFPEEEADVHLKRLKAWGFTTIRYLVTWEALEHGGPGKYDEAFIGYTIRILQKCREHGFRVFISAHQDAFSRFISGSGAPYWALVAGGLNPRRLHQTGSATLHASMDNLTSVNGSAIVIWNTNLHRLAARHCFTMFFASDQFAPKCTIDGQSAKDWLQGHYLAAYGHLADRLRDAGGILDECLIGWDSMNEPHQGFIGIPDLNSFPEAQNFRKGPSPTPIQGFQLGHGQKVDDVEMSDFTSTGQKAKGKVTITPPGGKGVWLTRDEARAAEARWGWTWGESWDFWEKDGEGGCPWAGHGVWDPRTGSALKKDYFHLPGKEDADFIEDFWRAHYEAYIKRIRESHPNAISFVNPPIFEEPPDLSEDVKEGRVAMSPHFYDGLTMLGKRRHLFNADAVGLQRGLTNMLSAIKLGPKSIKSTMRHQLGELKSDARKDEGIAAEGEGGNYPTLIGELGTPWDMKSTKLFGLAKGKADRKDYKEPAKAMDELLNACDGHNALSYTIWVYEPLSTHAHGDGWNGEDLSLISYDDTTPDSDEDLLIDNPPDMKTLMTLGTRGIESWCRPYPLETLGRIDKFSFGMKEAEFRLTLDIPSWSDPNLWANEDEAKGQGTRGIGEAAGRTESGDGEADGEVKEGYTKIYLPYIHYLHKPAPGSQESTASKKKKRIIGNPSTDGEEIWEAGADATGSEPARVDVEVIELTEGRLEVYGQWGLWFYPLVDVDGAKERKARLVIRPWRD